MEEMVKKLQRVIGSFLPVSSQHLPHFLLASAGYFIFSLGWFVWQGVSIPAAFPLVAVSYLVFTIALRGGLALHAAEQIVHMDDVEEGSIEPNAQIAKQSQGSDQEILRKKARLAALKREAARMHDKMFGMGAKISIGLVLYWVVFKLVFGSSPQDTFLVPLYLLAIIWLLQIIWLPSWLVYASFFSAAGLRFSFEVFGPTILLLLPNFLMLPIFYLVMTIFLYGSIMLPNIMQIKFHKPGDATWEVPEGTMRGQADARATTEVELRKFVAFAEGKSERPASRGIIFEGPPGTGKTLFAKEIGTRLELPYVYADAQALAPAFFGFAQFVVLYLRARTEALAKEYGGAIVFIDEAEQLFQVRSGMPGMTPFGRSTNQIWDMFSYDSAGCTSQCGIIYDTAQARERFWELKQAMKNRYEHQQMFFGGGGGGANTAIFSFLTWLDGVSTPPFLEKLLRGKTNELLDALFMPVTFRGRLLRVPPGKAQNYNILFLAATNRAWMLDPAIRRPGRFGVTARFKTPDVRARADVAALYLDKAIKKRWAQPHLLAPEKIEELARATPGMSPAELEQMINLAPDVRSSHVENLKRIKEMLDSGSLLENLTEEDRKFWLRHEAELEDSAWDDPRADWKSLMEARSQVLYGRADPGRVSSENRRRTAYHEAMGHFLPLKAFLGEQMRPTVLSVMPRGQALGMVAHVPVEERDATPQSFYEGLLRVSVGSVIAERFFFNENEPGVSSDLENATRIASFIVGKAAMVPYRCSVKLRQKYAAIGETLISAPDEHLSVSAGSKTFVDQVLANPKTRERVAVFLGQAAVDVYRLIRANKDLATDIVTRLQELDELSGKNLENLWDSLDARLIKLSFLSKEDRNLLPERMFFGQDNPFYAKTLQLPEAQKVVN